jgi:hypothetical protein
MAIAKRMLAARFNRPGLDIVDHRTFAVCGAGDDLAPKGQGRRLARMVRMSFRAERSREGRTDRRPAEVKTNQGERHHATRDDRPRSDGGQHGPAAHAGRSRVRGYDPNIADVAELWRRGSVIGSWLLDLLADALLQDPELSRVEGRVSDSGEGRWTIMAAIDEGVPAHVLSSALYERFSSRGDAGFADKLLSAMRHEFGGHIEKHGS